jgi:hypothetical protein
MRAVIRQKLAAGESRDAVLAYFAERYGDDALLDPPKHGFGLVVWGVPPLLLALGALLVRGQLAAWRRGNNVRTLGSRPRHLRRTPGDALTLPSPRGRGGAGHRGSRHRAARTSTRSALMSVLLAGALLLGPRQAQAAEPVVVERHAVAVLRPLTDERALDVLELIVLRNDAATTWQPRANGPEGPMGLLRFSLPPGAGNLRIGGLLRDAEIYPVDRGFATNAAIPPGRTEVTLAYRIAYGASAIVLTKTLPYRTERFELEEPIEVAGLAVGFDATDASTPTQRRYVGRDLPARTTITMHLQDLPAAPPPLLAPAVRWGVLALALAAALAAALLAWRPSRTAAGTAA